MIETMTMRLTRRAEEFLGEYLDQVRRSMERSPGTDAEDVVAGIREHVEAELGQAGATLATEEDVADVVERLGPPAAWDAPGAEGSPEPGAEAAAWSTVGAFVLIGLGTVLAFTARWAGLGWLLLIAGSLVIRLAATDDAGLPSSRRPVDRLATGWWWLATAAVAVFLLLAPAVGVWGAAQIGGPLETLLAARTGVSGYPRTWAYWGATAAVAAFVTGLWWVVLGSLVRVFQSGLRRALGPAAAMVPPRASRLLVRAGIVLGALSLLGLLA